MNVTHRFTLTEDQLRSIRASEGRSGRATRDEVRTWLDVLVQATLQDLPAPKRRRKVVEPPVAPPAPFTTAAAAPPNAICFWCGKIKDVHGRMGFACPAPRRSTFQPL